jgi:NhaP-type Na+/H+ or K+/H+ antiporter
MVSLMTSLRPFKSGVAVALGLVLGSVIFRVLSLLDSYPGEGLSDAGAGDGRRLAAPLEVMTAGLLVSGRARNLVLSAEPREHPGNFWELIDDMGNVVLFLLLGQQLLVLPIARGISSPGSSRWWLRWSCDVWCDAYGGGTIYRCFAGACLVFSIVVQGLTIPRLPRRLGLRPG